MPTAGAPGPRPSVAPDSAPAAVRSSSELELIDRPEIAPVSALPLMPPPPVVPPPPAAPPPAVVPPPDVLTPARPPVPVPLVVVVVEPPVTALVSEPLLLMELAPVLVSDKLPDRLGFDNDPTAADMGPVPPRRGAGV